MLLVFAILIYSSVIATNASTSPIFSGCGSLSHLDLIFILDSSGSVYDREYINWQSELDFAKTIVNFALPSDSKIGCINFSGCGSLTDFNDCKANNKLKKMWGLTDYGIPNDKLLVYDRFASMGPADFNQGWTWTNEALQIALNEFRGNSSIDRSKMIIILTDGFPQPADLPNKIQHEPCIVDYPTQGETYISPTLQALRDDKVLIIAIGIQLAQDKLDKYIKCLVEDIDNHFFYAQNFNALAPLASVISDIVCSEETYSPTISSKNPTSSPTQSSSPTTSPFNPTKISSENPTSPTHWSSLTPQTTDTTYNATESATDYEFCLDNSDNINARFIALNNEWSEVICEFCVCRDDKSDLICDIIDFNDIKRYDSYLIDIFMKTCQLNEECSFKHVDLKRPLEDITVCNCDLFHCNRQGNNANKFIFGVLIVLEAIIVMYLLM